MTIKCDFGLRIRHICNSSFQLNLKKKNMQKYISLFFVIVSLIPTIVLADDVRGRVLDASTGEPLFGANVILIESKIDSAVTFKSYHIDKVKYQRVRLGAASGENGEFVIKNVPPSSYQVKASYMGYDPAVQFIDLSQTNPVLLFELKDSFFQTEQVVVTATRTKKLMENVPVVTELITADEIEETGSEDLADILNDRPGIYISENDVGGKNIRMGGVDGKYILVLVDGMPITGKFNNRQELNLIDADLIERIEIVKGPSSAIYGSEAMGGVINIITKNIGNGFSVDAKGKTGSFDLYSANARLSGKMDSLGLALNFDHTEGGVDPSLTSLNVRNSRNSMIGGRLDYHSPVLGFFELDATQQQGDQNGQDPLFRFETDLARTDGRISWRRDLGDKKNASIRAYASQYDRGYREIVKRSGYVRTENGSIENIYGLKSDFSYEFFTTTRLDVGFDYSYDEYRSTRNSVSSADETALNAQRDLFGVFAQIESGPIHNVTLLFGGRYDKMSDVESYFSPRLSGMYNLTPNLKFRASHGGGFRAPSFNDMYIDFDHTSFGYRVVGNPDLVPEKSTGNSVGLEYFWNYRVLTNLTYYRNFFTDMIVDYPVDPIRLPGTLSYKNIERATINSVEVQSKFYILKNMTAQLAYNYTKIMEQEASEEVLNMPPHSASVKMNWSFWRGFELSLRDQFFGAQKVREFEPLIGDYVDRLTTKQSYHLLDATLTYKPGRHLSVWVNSEATKKIYNMFTLRIGATNLSDYTDVQYGPWIGRRFFLAMDVNY